MLSLDEVRHLFAQIRAGLSQLILERELDHENFAELFDMVQKYISWRNIGGNLSTRSNSFEKFIFNHYPVILVNLIEISVILGDNPEYHAESERCKIFARLLRRVEISSYNQRRIEIPCEIIADYIENDAALHDSFVEWADRKIAAF